LDLRDINKSISGFGGMNDNSVIRNKNDTTNKIGFALKNELASPTKKLPILRKNSISEKSEENRKSVESDLKKDLNQFKIAKLGNFGDEFLSPNAQGENAMDTIRRLSERNISEKKRKLSISNAPQTQSYLNYFLLFNFFNFFIVLLRFRISLKSSLFLF